jgi:transposase
MVSFTGGLKIFVALEPCDMRKGFGSLCGAVYDQLKEGAHRSLRIACLFALQN